MVGFLSTWFGQLLMLAGAAGTLGAIARAGYWFGTQVRQRDLFEEIDDLKSLLNASREEVSAHRSETLKWKSRSEEAAAGVDVSSAHRKLENIRSLIDDNRSVWLRTPTQRFSPRLVRSGGKPILTIANLKGGVGKTTFAVHLAAAFARKYKVLLIDLDYQGTASTFLLRAAGFNEDARQSRASQLIAYRGDNAFLEQLPVSLGRFRPHLSIIPAHYPLADAEDDLMLRWLIEDEPDDIRYNLSRALQDERLDYDFIVIDAPPRLTTAMAQALAASTHVLIPTQLERKSTEAAIYFSGLVHQFVEKGVNINLSLLGIVPNQVQSQPGYRPQEVAEMAYLREQTGRVWPAADVVWENAPIYDRVAFSRSNLVFDGTDQVASGMMTRLAAEVVRRTGLEFKGSS